MDFVDRVIRSSGLTVLAAMLLSTAAFADVPAVSPSPSVDSGLADAKPEPIEAAPLPVSEETAAGGNPILGISLKALSQTRERPIFSPSRRPPSVAAPQVEVPEPSPIVTAADPERPPLSLIGTVSGAEQDIGVFLSQTNNEVVRLRLGEASDGWTLRSISRRRTILEKDKQEVSLEIPAPGADAASAVASPPGGFPGVGMGMPPGMPRPSAPHQMPAGQSIGGRHRER